MTSTKYNFPNAFFVHLYAVCNPKADMVAVCKEVDNATYLSHLEDLGLVSTIRFVRAMYEWKDSYCIRLCFTKKRLPYLLAGLKQEFQRKDIPLFLVEGLLGAKGCRCWTEEVLAVLQELECYSHPNMASLAVQLHQHWKRNYANGPQQLEVLYDIDRLVANVSI